jgi:VIT1/CCC1 family predicted Fe2+/Mn2+ transporter
VAALLIKNTLILAGLSSMIGGALSMACGEFISVYSQRDTEIADLAKEKFELEHAAESELEELTMIYIERGLSRKLAEQVAKELTEKDALRAHARDELGIVG